MAEFTETFPMGQQVDDLMNMYVYVITFDLPTLTIVFSILTLLFFILYQIFNGLFFWFVETRPNEHDLEEGVTELEDFEVNESSHHVTMFHALVHSNLHDWNLGTAFGRVFYEKRGQKLRASKILPPLVNYGMHGVAKSCGDCAICLEDFQVGQFCQVFPGCTHLFDSDCIDHWLQKKLTCPICRSCI